MDQYHIAQLVAVLDEITQQLRALRRSIEAMQFKIDDGRNGLRVFDYSRGEGSLEPAERDELGS